MKFPKNVLFLVITLYISDAQIMECSESNEKFEKVIGLRPPDTIETFLLHTSKNSEPITEPCLKKCLANVECKGFILFYNISQCFWYKINDSEDRYNILDPNTAWFVKTCLNVDNCQKSWVFERVSGAILIGNVKTLPKKVTRQECQQHCLEEVHFDCRSANFKIVDTSNLPYTLGICSLSDTDRHLMPISYRVSSYDEEYFENQCSKTTTNEMCDFEEYENSTLMHVDLIYENKSTQECKELCKSEITFKCRGFTILPLTHSRNNCLIHSEDSKVHGPKFLKNATNVKYYEQAPCLNVTVLCTERRIKIIYKPAYNFYGKVYMQGYSENRECYTTGKGNETVWLNIQLFTKHCGIIEAKSRGYLNKTLWSGIMIIQYNPLIQTQGDRILRVGCIFGNDSSVLLGTGINFTTSYPNVGSAVINTTMNTPTVEMSVVDFFSHEEVTETQIGQELQLVIQLNSPNGNQHLVKLKLSILSSFDIWAGHLVAMTDNGQDSILLLDDRGCPTNTQIFPALTKVSDHSSRKLVANFQAFKFSSSPIIRFSVMVQFCPKLCAPIECTNNTVSYGRRKRNLAQLLDITDSTTVAKLSRDQFNSEGNETVITMPLEFVMVVKKNGILPDRFIYGENNKVLIAGYDLTTNEVCIDYSVFVGIVISWVLLQVILLICVVAMIRKYKKHYYRDDSAQSLEELHKNFEIGFRNLEPRHVRWGNNREYT